MRMASLEGQAKLHACNAMQHADNLIMICFSFVLIHVALWNKVSLPLLRLRWCHQHICNAGLGNVCGVAYHVSAIFTGSLTPKGEVMSLGPSNSVCPRVICSAIYISSPAGWITDTKRGWHVGLPLSLLHIVGSTWKSTEVDQRGWKAMMLNCIYVILTSIQ